MERAGAAMTSVETALFELLGGSDADEFKAVQALRQVNRAEPVSR